MAQAIRQIVVIDEGRRVLVGCDDGRVLSFGMDGRERIAYEGLEGHAIDALAESGDRIVAFADDGAGLAWDEAGRPVDTLSGAGRVVRCAAATDYATLDAFGTIRVWRREGAEMHAEVVTGAEGKPLRAQSFGAQADGRLLTVASGFCWSVWDRETKAVVRSGQPVAGLGVDYLSGDTGVTQSGRFFYIYWDDYWLVDTATGQAIQRGDILLHPSTTALSDDGQVLAVGGEAGELAVAGPDGQALFQGQGSHGAIVQASVGRAGKLAAFVDDMGGAICVDVEQGQVVLARDELAERLG